MGRKTCVYCGKEITKRSREHVIQNALGGLYESEDICCPECNNYISSCIDAPFTKIFNPIIGNIDDFSKTNNTKSTPAYSGIVSYKDKLYHANIKNGKVVSCPDLSREQRCDISKIPVQIISYDFNINNNDFKTGIAKIAFNYALDKGIDFDILKGGLDIKKTGPNIQAITFNYPIIPFYPLNPIDSFIELKTNFNLYHTMILFSQHNTLWCYIDLFNTFQYYVLLSESMPAGTHVYENYAQTLQKINRKEPTLDIFSPKDIMIYAQQYGVEPCMDLSEFSRRIKNAIAKKSQKQDLQSIISSKMSAMPLEYRLNIMQDTQKLIAFGQSMHLYFDENDCLIPENFRTLTISEDGTKLLSYPYAINTQISHDIKPLKKYTMDKFERLTLSLCQKSR